MSLTTRTAITPCPTCGRGVDAATHARAEVPKEGDVSICWYCATPLVFGPDLELRHMTFNELLEHRQNPEFMKILHMVRAKACVCMSGEMCPVHGVR